MAAHVPGGAAGRETFHENEIDFDDARRRFPVRRDAFFDWRRHRYAGLLRTASAAGGRLRASALPRSSLHVGGRILVYCRSTLLLARRLRGPPAICRRLLGGPSLLRSPLL